MGYNKKYFLLILESHKRYLSNWFSSQEEDLCKKYWKHLLHYKSLSLDRMTHLSVSMECEYLILYFYFDCACFLFFFKNPTLFQTSQPSDQPHLNVFQCKSHGFSKVSPNCTESKEMHIYLFLSLNHHLESFSKVPTLILYRSVSTW